MAAVRSPVDRSFARAGLLAALMVTCMPLRADGPTPVQVCDFNGADFLSSGEKQNGNSVDDLARELPKMLDACRKAVEAEPRSARLHARYARVLAVAGDTPGALKEARLGSELGSTMAMVLLGVMHADGNGVARDYGAALKLFRDAAKKDHPLAYFNLGVMHANGWGTPADDAEAVAQFHRAAGGYDPLAMQILGEAYARGRGVVADPAAVERWWKQAGERPQALPEGHRNPLRIAPLGRVEPDGAVLLAWYERQARAGELWAQNYVGHLYEAGQWVAQDYAMAQTWYRRAAEAGFIPAQMSMAMVYWKGLGVERDDRESRRWSMMSVHQYCDRAVQAEPGANACDRFAADAYDPGKVVPGISAYCMSRYADQAIPACRKAVAEFPSTLRYRAQLARALAHAGKFDEARREADIAQANGSTLAMTLLGAMDEYGYGAPKNEVDALAWYRKAANLDDDRAIGLVSMRAMAGVGVAKDSPEAKALSREMGDRQLKNFSARSAPVSPVDALASQAEKGDAKAQQDLAFELERQKKYDEAIKWYTRAAEQGSGISQMNLAQMYEKGMGAKQDFGQAKKWYRKSMESGNGEALYRLAALSDKTGDEAEALKLFRRGVQHDDYRAVVDLGEKYEQGRGVKKDVAQAAQLYEQAGDRSRWAQFKLGILYMQGDGVPKSEAKALQWWQKSADGGNGKAQNNLGFMHDRGMVVQRDYRKALDWYLLAQARGVPQAKANLEDLFEEGRGAPAEPSNLAAWYRTGAEAGVASAQYRLGTFYAKGRGVARDELEAVKWLQWAVEQGYAKAIPELADAYFVLGQRYERGEGVAPDQQAAMQFYSQAALLGNKRALDRMVEIRERAGDRDSAAKLREFIAHAPAPAVREQVKLPVGFNFDPGKDEQREMQIRVAGTGQMASATNSADAFTVIVWIPPQPNKANRP
jgi:TPR repeat protein